MHTELAGLLVNVIRWRIFESQKLCYGCWHGLVGFQFVSCYGRGPSAQCLAFRNTCAQLYGVVKAEFLYIATRSLYRISGKGSLEAVCRFSTHRCTLKSKKFAGLSTVTIRFFVAAFAKPYQHS